MSKFEWPVDEDGKPMVLVSNGAEEKVGMPNYSNVVLGPASVSRFVKDDPEAIKQGLRECLAVCEELISEEREAVIEIVNAAKAQADRR